jgi:hypothetical protein
VHCGDRGCSIDLLHYHYRPHRYVVFEQRLSRFGPEYVGNFNFYVQLVEPTCTTVPATPLWALVVGRDDVTVEMALRGVTASCH